MKRAVIVMLLLILVPVFSGICTETAAPAVEESSISLKWVNFGLVVFSLVAGGMWLKARAKIKELGELFLKIYEFTDPKSEGGKKFSKNETKDLEERIFQLIGKKAPE